MKAAEALSAGDIADAQNEHYNLDDTIRRTLGKLTLAQKREVVDKIQKIAETLKQNDNESGT